MKHLPLLLLVMWGCASDAEPVGARGLPIPRHIKPPKVEKDIPDDPMITHHVLEMTDPCGGKCKYTRTGESMLSLHLAKNGVATATDEGERVERVQTSAAKNAERAKWKRTWTGSWSEGERAVEVVLKPTEHTCTRTNLDGGPDEACDEGDELRLRCKLVLLPLVKSKEARARAWSCETRIAPKATALTPLPWIFGVERRVVVLDGGRSDAPTRRYTTEEAH